MKPWRQPRYSPAADVQLERPGRGPRLRAPGALFILAGAGHLLKAWNLLYSTSGAVFGAGYTDVHVRLPLIRFLMVVAFLLGGALIYNAVRGRRSSGRLWLSACG